MPGATIERRRVMTESDPTDLRRLADGGNATAADELIELAAE
jgi:hypothetical protein